MNDYRALRIVFFGTPGFAVESLRALLDAGCNVVAAVTMPDKPGRRGMQLQQSAVKEFALSRGLPVLQPEKLKSPEFNEALRAYRADVQVVVAFRMLPEMVWNAPPLGTINVHASLLPQYRGAAPINRAIINGEPETGITTFRLKHEIDTGNILLQSRLPILPEDNAGTLHDKLALEGGRLIVETICGLADGSIQEKPQPANDAVLRHAPKIFKEDCVINWNQPGEAIANFVRGLSPVPGAACTLSGKHIKVYRCEARQEAHDQPIGAWETDEKTYLRVAVPNGWIYLHEVQLEGKKRMGIEDFLRGRPLRTGE